MNSRGALGVAGVVAVAVTVGVVAGLSLSGGPASGDAGTTSTLTSTPTATPEPTGTRVLTTISPTTTPAPSPTPSPTATAEAAVSPPSVEYLVYQRVNYLRTSRGYEQLSLNASLRAVARYHSEGMAREGELDHEGSDGETLADRLDRFDVDCGSSTETVGRVVAGTPVQDGDGWTVTHETEKEVANAIVRDWMDRPTPRSEILRLEWTDVAVGVHTVESEDGTAVYATMVLCEMEPA